MAKHEDVKQDKPMMEKIAKKAVKGHEAKMHKGYKKGGPTSMDMKKHGRNMAKVMNQRGSSRGK
jgi:hypothetical protein